MQDAVAGFVPKAADLDYPARLQQAVADSNGAEEVEADPLIPLSNGDAHLPVANSEEQVPLPYQVPHAVFGVMLHWAGISTSNFVQAAFGYHY